MDENNKKTTLCLILSFIISLIIFGGLYYFDRPNDSLSYDSLVETLDFPNNTVITEWEILLEPSYFFSIGEIWVAVDSPSHFDKINVSLSIDKKHWIPINVSPYPIDRNNKNEYEFIKEVPINQWFKIFLKVDKISNDPLPVTVYYTHPDINIRIRMWKFWEGKRWVLIVLVFVALLGTTFCISISYKDIIYNLWGKFRKSIVGFYIKKIKPSFVEKFPQQKPLKTPPHSH